MPTEAAIERRKRRQEALAAFADEMGLGDLLEAEPEGDTDGQLWVVSFLLADPLALEF